MSATVVNATLMGGWIVPLGNALLFCIWTNVFMFHHSDWYTLTHFLGHSSSSPLYVYNFLILCTVYVPPSPAILIQVILLYIHILTHMQQRGLAWERVMQYAFDLLTVKMQLGSCSYTALVMHGLPNTITHNITATCCLPTYLMYKKVPATCKLWQVLNKDVYLPYKAHQMHACVRYALCWL